MLADIAPTQIAWTPDRIADPLDMACRTWKHPHAIAISQKFTFKSLLPDSKLRPDGQRPSMKRVSVRNANNRRANSRLTGVSGGRVRRHGGVDGVFAKSGHGDAANQAR
jgi:hypothetical protein